MLHEFIAANRDEILARCRARLALKTAPRPSESELEHGVPLFLDQLTETLRLALDPSDSLSASATLRGGDLLRRGFTIAQVVHNYGEVCQTVTELAVEKDKTIRASDYKTFNLCLDEAIADAVTEYGRLRESEGKERLAHLAHELGNRLNEAFLALDALKSGAVGFGGSTGALLTSSLTGLRNLVGRELAEVRLGAGIQHPEIVVVRDFVEDIEVAAVMEASARALKFSILSVAPNVIIETDRQILASVVTNLLQNAFKFTHAGGQVALRLRTTPDRLLIEVEDECGGLPPGRIDALFQPHEQRSGDRTGLGLGLTIAERGTRALGGDIEVRNRDGVGCVFTVVLPLASAR
jgi:signal transduction histidine kinase